MYYVTDPYHPELKQHLQKAVLQQQAKYQRRGVLQVYALVDGALDESWGRMLWDECQRSPQELRAVYGGTPLEEAEDAGLFLGLVQEDQVDLLLSRARARPMLSFLQSALNLDQLSAHLAQFSRGQTRDSYWFPLRWGCPNRILDLIAVLEEGPHKVFMDGIAAWHLIDRGGDIKSIEGTMGTAALAGTPVGLLRHGIALSDKAFAQLLDAGEADMILSRAFTQLPEEVAGRHARQLHDMTQAVLQEMDRLHIHSHRLRSELVMQSLRCKKFEDAQALIQERAL